MSDDSKKPAAGDTLADGRLPSSAMRSYALLTPNLKELYMGFYKATYGKSKLDLKTKEYIAIAAALTSGCKGCLEGHLKKAKKEGATSEEIAEVIAITLGVNAATIVDRSDIANFHLGGLFEKPEAG
jgi:AhpD family alkylhydroperoxidase